VWKLAEQDWVKELWYLLTILAVHSLLFVLEHWLALLVIAAVLYLVWRPIRRRWRRRKHETYV